MSDARERAAALQNRLEWLAEDIEAIAATETIPGVRRRRIAEVVGLAHNEAIEAAAKWLQDKCYRQLGAKMSKALRRPTP